MPEWNANAGTAARAFGKYKQVEFLSVAAHSEAKIALVAKYSTGTEMTSMVLTHQDAERLYEELGKVLGK